MEPVSGSSGICTTSAELSRHGRRLEWCSCGPTRTTGCASRARPEGRRQVHAEDEAQLVDGRGRAASREHDHVGVLVRVPDARVHACAISWRASWRKHVDCGPHVLVVVCVLAYSGRTSSRT